MNRHFCAALCVLLYPYLGVCHCFNEGGVVVSCNGCPGFGVYPCSTMALAPLSNACAWETFGFGSGGCSSLGESMPPLLNTVAFLAHALVSVMPLCLLLVLVLALVLGVVALPPLVRQCYHS